MPNTVIAIRQSGETGNTPSLGVLANGELALNYADGILYYKTTANTLGSIRTTQPSGLNQEVQFNDSGSFGGNSAFTFNKSLATLNVTNINTSSIITGGGSGGIISGANVIYSNTFVANTGGYFQFADGTIQYTANAGGGSVDSVARTTANAAFDKANTDVTSITATAGVYGNATHVPVITLTANGRISSIVNTAISGGGGSSANGFGQIVANGGTILATTSNDSLQIVGESGITVTSNISAKKVVVSVPAGFTFTSADYGFVYEDTNVIYDYGTL
jgi:hypothetical protein